MVANIRLLNLRPSNLQLMPWNFQMQYSYLLSMSTSFCITWRKIWSVHSIHLLHAGEGNMKIYSPKSIIFSEGNARGGTWYSWVNKFSYFLNPHAINVLLYRMKPRKHIHTAGKHILSPLERCLRIWCVPSASDVFLWKNDSSGGKTHEASEGVEYDFHFTEYDFCPVWSRVLIFTHCPIKLIYEV